MSQMNENDLLRHISDGISTLTPDDADSLWEQSVPAASESAWFLDHTAKQKHPSHRKGYLVSAIAACLLLTILSTFILQWIPSASVYLDVNPSLTLGINYRNRITNVTACNDDAACLLSDLDLKGSNLDVALYAILGSMVHHGYLTETQDTILVSVSSSNSGRAASLKQQVTDLVSQDLHVMIQAGEVLSQQVDVEKVSTPSPSTVCTPGKTAFVDQLEEKYPQLIEDNLEEMTVDEIVTHLVTEDLDYSDYLIQDDDDDDDNDDDDEETDDNDDLEEDDDDEDPDEDEECEEEDEEQDD